MIENTLHISTGEAAEIVQVHESTVKRWCDAGELDFELTAGGHRRIELRSLLEHAATAGLDCELLSFGSAARRVYESEVNIAREGDFGAATRLAEGWLDEGAADSLALFFTYLHDRAVSCPSIFDHIVRPIMHDIGHGWEDGDLGVGDEHRLSNVMIDATYAFRGSLRREMGANGRMAVVGCLEGNRHDIAANLVRIVLESAGWKVMYLGADVPLQEVILQQRAGDASLVCLSMAEPQVASDVVRATRVLSTLYEPSHAYRLAIGGTPVRDAQAELLEELPFLACRTFTTTTDFSRWIAEVPSASGEEVCK